MTVSKIYRGPRCLLTAGLIMTLCACGAQACPENNASVWMPAVPAEDESGLSLAEQERVYVIEPIPGRQWLVNRRGETVNPQEQSLLIYDQLTRQPQYKVRTRRVLTGETDEFDQPVYRTFSALFSLQDECLADWDEVVYEGGFGSWLIRRDYTDEFDYMTELPDDYQTALIDGVSGAVLVEGIQQLKALNETQLIALDKQRMLMGVIDSQGQIVSGFPADRPYYDPEAVSGMILAGSAGIFEDGQRQSQDYLLDAQLKEVVSAAKINAVYKGLQGPYFIAYGKTVNEIISFDHFQTVYRYAAEQEFSYFDGERIIVYNEPDSAGKESMSLKDLEGNELFQADQLISSLPDASRTPAEQFLAVKAETALRIGRSGNILKEKPIPGLNALYCDQPGLIFYEVYNNEGKIRTGLLNSEFEEIVKADLYDSISTAVYLDYKTQAMDYLIASRSEKGTEVLDILDLEGNVIFNGAQRITSRGQDRFAVVRNEEAGLIDKDGNWIVRRSIYSLNWDD